jgi:hypothetical protein
MKYTKKIPEPDPELREALLAEGWEKIREPYNLFYAFIFAIPFMIINASVCSLILLLVNPYYAHMFYDFLYSVSWYFTIRFDYIIYVYFFVVAHELIHLIFIPNFYRSEKTYIGIKPWGGFVFSTEKISKGRFFLITVAPFVVLSIMALIILGLADLLNGFLLFLIFINALSSSVDILNAVLIAIQVPNGSTIVNNGFETYFKAL